MISNYKPINGYFTYARVNKGTRGKLEQRAGLTLDPDQLGGRSIGDAGQWYLKSRNRLLDKDTCVYQRERGRVPFWSRMMRASQGVVNDPSWWRITSKIITDQKIPARVQQPRAYTESRVAESIEVSSSCSQNDSTVFLCFRLRSVLLSCSFVNSWRLNSINSLANHVVQ